MMILGRVSKFRLAASFEASTNFLMREVLWSILNRKTSCGYAIDFLLLINSGWPLKDTENRRPKELGWEWTKLWKIYGIGSRNNPKTELRIHSQFWGTKLTFF
jgi:hypothetical protein